MAKCPYTSVTLYQETLYGTIVEKNPEKKDKVFEVNEDISYAILLNNIKTHTKKPISGIQVTIYNPDKKPKTAVTDAKGEVIINPNKEGKWYVSYYDQYQKRSVVVTFTVVAGASLPDVDDTIPDPTPLPKPSPKPQDGDKDDFTIEDGPKPDEVNSALNRFIIALRAFMATLTRKKK